MTNEKLDKFLYKIVGLTPCDKASIAIAAHLLGFMSKDNLREWFNDWYDDIFNRMEIFDEG